MWLLYLDDSGSTKNASDKHVILAGIAVFETSPHFLSERLEEIAQRLYSNDRRELEFHGSEIFAGRKLWRSIDKIARMEAFEEALDIIGKSHSARLFGAVIHKASVSPDDPMEMAFEHLISRFDRFLGRLFKLGNKQRGLVVLDKSSYETTLQNLAIYFKEFGHRWGNIYNMADVPLFVDSRATRMIQYADLIAYSLRLYYERGQSFYFDKIKRSFDSEGGVLHGLVHDADKATRCACFACLKGRPARA